MRIRVLLGAALALVCGLFVLELSHAAPRMAGSNEIAPDVFAARVPQGGTLCQAETLLPHGAASARILLGTYGAPVPALQLTFAPDGGPPRAIGSLPAGRHEGTIAIPLAPVPRGDAYGTLCLHVGPSAQRSFVLGGESADPSATTAAVAGVPQPGRFAVTYYRAGSESWWQILGEVARRFGYGKAPLFGTWTFWACALLLLATWVAVVRLLLRELR